MSFLTGQLGVCEISHKNVSPGDPTCPELVYGRRITMNIPITNLIRLTDPDCDCFHRMSGLLNGGKVAGPDAEVTAWNLQMVLQKEWNAT